MNNTPTINTHPNGQPDNWPLIRRIIAAAALCGFAVILVCLLTDHTAAFDDTIRQFFYGLRCSPLTGIAVFLTYLANKYVIIAFCLILLLVPKTRMQFGIPLSAAALGVTLLNTLIKHIVQRPRPEVLHLVEEGGFSFTSGHSITSMCFYGLAIWLVNRHVENQTARRVLTVLLLIPLVLIGPTRIYLGVHYPTDVLAGWCLGIFAIIVTIEICEYIRRRS